MVRYSLLAIICVMAMVFTSEPSYGQASGSVDRQSNGQPTAGKVDEASVAKLREAEALYAQEGHEREALEKALDLIKVFEKNEDMSSLVDCTFLVAEAYYFLGEWASAEKYMGQAWDLGTRHFPDQMSGYPLKVIGECQFEQGKQKEALSTFQERVQWLRKQDNKDELPGALFDTGGLLINNDRAKDAIPVLKEAAQANNSLAAELAKPDSGATQEQKDANVVDHAEITYHLAIAYFRLEEYNDARLHLEQAHAFFKSILEGGRFDVRDRLVAVCDDLVLVNEELGNPSAAEVYRRERDRLNE